VVHTVKTYDNATAIPLIKPLLGPKTFVLTLQNGVDSAEQIAAVAGEQATLGGSTYIATAIEGPGVIRQTGTHRRIVFGEYFNPPASITSRVKELRDEMAASNIVVEPVVDSRHTIWEKFTYLAPFAAFTWRGSACRSGRSGPTTTSRTCFSTQLSRWRTSRVRMGSSCPDDHRDRVYEYAIKLPPSTRSSLLIDLQQGKRIEVEALQGSVVRRGANGRRADADHVGAVRRSSNRMRTDRCSSRSNLNYFASASLRVPRRPAPRLSSGEPPRCPRARFSSARVMPGTTPKSDQPFSGFRLRSSQ
jgi:2-dehydropantoate 2-reductase